MLTTRSIVRRFYAYRLSVSNGFYLPLSVLYLERVRGFGLDEIGLIMGAFSIAMVIAEIPTGYLGDRLGRRAALAAGNVLSAGFMAGYVVVESPLGYLLLHVVWAFGWAFRSGTADAWLYELLAVGGDEDSFTRYRSRATTLELAFEAATAAAAGALAAAVGWGVPFLANAVIAAVGVPLLLASPSVDDVRETVEATDEGARDRSAAGDRASRGHLESGGDTGERARSADDGERGGPTDESLSVRDAIEVLRLQIRRPEVRWLVAYVTLFAALYSVVRTFEQPALGAVGVPVAGLGALYAGFKLVSAGAASTAGWLADRLGPAGVLALLGPVYGIAFLGVAAFPVLVVPALFLNRSVRVVVQPIRDQYLNDRLADVGRATALSGASMAISVTSGVAKVVGGEAAAVVGPVAILVVAGVGVPIVGGILWVAVSPVRSIDGSSAADAAKPTD